MSTPRSKMALVGGLWLWLAVPAHAQSPLALHPCTLSHAALVVDCGSSQTVNGLPSCFAGVIGAFLHDHAIAADCVATIPVPSYVVPAAATVPPPALRPDPEVR